MFFTVIKDPKFYGPFAGAMFSAIYLGWDVLRGGGNMNPYITIPFVFVLVVCVFMMVISAYKTVKEERDRKNNKGLANYRQYFLEKKQIPERLFAIDLYLKSAVMSQRMTGKIFVDAMHHWLNWRDIPTFILLTIIWFLPIKHRFLPTFQVNWALKYCMRWNITMREHRLGTLPIIESDTTYCKMYEELMHIENGLPQKTTGKIHRFVNISIPLNSLRLLSPEQPFWNELYAKKGMERLLQTSRNAMSVLLLPLDAILTNLRSEIAQDIENYFVP